MNRHGLKQKLKEATKELNGGRKLSLKRTNSLKRRILMYRNLLQYKHPKKKKGFGNKK